MTSPAGRVLIYGGRGALGSTCVNHFKTNKYWVGCIDLTENTSADFNIVVKKDTGLEEQESHIHQEIKNALNGNKLDAVICVAGGWAGGNAKKDLTKNSDLMWKQSVWSSLISASVAADYLKEGGLITLTGAKAALDPTPGMIGYGVAKAAVHQLTKSLAADNGGLPSNATAVAILPVTLDTPMNRKWMPKAEFSTWTPLEYVAELFIKWTANLERPKNGSLVQLITANSQTNLVIS